MLSSFPDSKFVGTVDKDQKALDAEQKALFDTANERALAPKVSSVFVIRRVVFSVMSLTSYILFTIQDKKKMRGRNKISAKLRRKQKNVVDAQSIKLKEKLQQEKDEREKAKTPVPTGRVNKHSALQRFFKKGT